MCAGRAAFATFVSSLASTATRRAWVGLALGNCRLRTGLAKRRGHARYELFVWFKGDSADSPSWNWLIMANIKMEAIAQQHLSENANTAIGKSKKAGHGVDDDEKEVGLLQSLFQATNSKDVLLQTNTGIALVALRESGEILSWRETFFLILNEPGSGFAAFILGRFLQICLVTSALCTTYETVSFINESTGSEPWMMAKVVLNIVFTVETAVRIICYIPLGSIHKSGYIWLDVVTCIPLYFRVLLYPASFTPRNYLSKAGTGITIRVMEAISGFRILKLCRYYEGASLLALAVGKSLKQLYVPLFMLLLMVFCFAAIVYEIEFDASVQSCVELWKKQGIATAFIKSHGDGVSWDCTTCTQVAECQRGDASCVADYDMKCKTCDGYPIGHPECNGIGWGQTFPDIPRSMWFMFVTVSTVGYGDVSPTTWQGQIFVCIVIICGLIFLAMPLAIVGSTFGRVWNDRQIIKLQRHIRQMLAHSGIEPTDAVSAFNKIDESGDGNLGFEEFKTFLIMHDLDMEKEDMKELWNALDTDKSGTVTLEEFMERTFPDTDLETIEELTTVENRDSRPKKASDGNHKVMHHLLKAQQANTELLEKKLADVEGALAELIANRGRKGNSIAGSPSEVTRRKLSFAKLSRAQSQKVIGGGGRSGTKGKPGSKVLGGNRTEVERSEEPQGGKPAAAPAAGAPMKPTGKEGSSLVGASVQDKRAHSKRLLQGLFDQARRSPTMSEDDEIKDSFRDGRKLMA